MPDFYPSAKVRLFLRFDEVDQTTSLVLPTGTDGNPLRQTDRNSSPQARLAAAAAQAGLRYVEQARGQYRIEKLVTGSVRSVTSQGEWSPDELSFVVGSFPPNSMSVELNGIRSADTFKVEFPFADAPFDPRLIRACGVELFLGVVSKEDFAMGVEHRMTRPNGEPLSLVPDERRLSAPEQFGSSMVPSEGQMDLSGIGVAVSNRRLQGFADSWSVQWARDGQALISIEGRDMTSILIDAVKPSGIQADLTKPLDEAVAELLSTLPATQGMSVEMRPYGTEAPVMARVAPRHSRPRRGNAGVRLAGKGNEKVSYWDYITDVCAAAGFIVFVDGSTVAIQTPRTIFGTRYPRRDGDPFRGRSAEEPGQQWRFEEYRRFLYGRNILEIGAERKFAAKKVNTVEVRCYDTQTKTTVYARFPSVPKVTDAPPGAAGGDERIDVFRVSNIRDGAVLRRIAQSIYEQQGRNEINFKITTKDLSSFGGDNEDPDLLDMKAGDPIKIRFVRQEEFDTVTQLQSMDSPSRVSFLERLGFSRELAQKYSQLLESSGFQDVFRVRDLTFDWSINDGVSIQVGAINYFTIREETYLPVGEEPEAPRSQSVTPRDSADRPASVRINQTNPESDDPLYPLNLEDEL